MLMPFGFLLSEVFEKLRKLSRIILISFAFSAFIEFTQLITARGTCEMDDIMNNTLGAVIGYYIWIILISIDIKLKTLYWNRYRVFVFRTMFKNVPHVTNRIKLSFRNNYVFIISNINNLIKIKVYITKKQLTLQIYNTNQIKYDKINKR